jgi:hypothetical protein
MMISFTLTVSELEYRKSSSRLSLEQSCVAKAQKNPAA